MNLITAVWRIEMWPVSTYDMFSRYNSTRSMFRPAYLEGEEIKLISFPFNSKWFRQKYLLALRKGDIDLVQQHLLWDCRRQYGEKKCAELELVLVRRQAVETSEKMIFVNKVVPFGGDR